MRNFITEWINGIKIIGKLILFLLILMVFGLPWNFLDGAVRSAKESSSDILYAVLATTYWLSVIIFMPFVYGRVAREVELIPENDETPDTEAANK